MPSSSRRSISRRSASRKTSRKTIVKRKVRYATSTRTGKVRKVVIKYYKGGKSKRVYKGSGKACPKRKTLFKTRSAAKKSMK